METQTFDTIFCKIQNLVRNENRKMQDELGFPLSNFDKLFYDTKIPFGSDRTLHIRCIKIPTFIRDNKPQYHAVFLSDISFWGKIEFNAILAQCKECIDNRDVNSHVIFQLGKFHGYFDPMYQKNMRYHHMMIFNNTVLTRKQVGFIVKVIQNYFEARCKGVLDGRYVYGSYEKDVERLHRFNENLGLLFRPVERPVYNIVRD